MYAWHLRAHRPITTAKQIVQMQRSGVVTHLVPILDLRHQTPASPCPRRGRPSQNDRRMWLAQQECNRSEIAGSHQAEPLCGKLHCIAGRRVGWPENIQISLLPMHKQQTNENN
jgi:hypothetical protein